MIGISSFFTRWKSKELEEIVFRTAVADSFREVLRFELDPLSISYSSNSIFLRISPAVKSAVLLKKEALLEKIREKTTRKVFDIR
jgi:hypothetical protein